MATNVLWHGIPVNWTANSGTSGQLKFSINNEAYLTTTPDTTTPDTTTANIGATYTGVEAVHSSIYDYAVSGAPTKYGSKDFLADNESLRNEVDFLHKENEELKNKLQDEAQASKDFKSKLALKLKNKLKTALYFERSEESKLLQLLIQDIESENV